MPASGENEERGRILSGLVSGRLKEIEERLRSQELTQIYGKGPLGFALSEILLIKDWGKISGIKQEFYTYLGNLVLETKRNLVIIAVSSANLIGKGGAEPPYILLTGPGIYLIEFSTQKGTYITDSREITGLLVSPSDWEKMRNAKKDYDGTSALTLNEIFAEIPLSIIDRPSSLQSYERGLIAKTVLTPFKDAFISLKNTCMRGSSYPEEHGPKMLSTHKYFHNLILIGPEIYEWASKKATEPWNEVIVRQAKDYLREIPGVKVSKPGELDAVLQTEVIEGISRGYLKDARRGISLTSVPSVKEFMMRVEVKMAKDQYLKAITGALERGF
jgi:hypothetical protein